MKSGRVCSLPKFGLRLHPHMRITLRSTALLSSAARGPKHERVTVPSRSQFNTIQHNLVTRQDTRTHPTFPHVSLSSSSSAKARRSLELRILTTISTIIFTSSIHRVPVLSCNDYIDTTLSSESVTSSIDLHSPCFPHIDSVSTANWLSIKNRP